MAFIFKLTAEGRDALLNASHTGLAARTVVSVGITATAIAPGSAIAGEIKRISTIAGDVLSAGVIHVTIRDDSADTYTVRGYGLYLENGVLLGSYGQADPIINKTSASIMLLATDSVLLDGSVDVSTLVFGDANFANPAATTDRPGVVQLATVAEAQAGVSIQRAVTPAALKSVLGQRIVYFTSAQPLPSEDIGPIWHDAYASLMTWKVFNANGANYAGYASVDIGWLRPDTQPITRNGWFKTGSTGWPTGMALYHWALHHGLVQAAGAWQAGTLFFRDNGNGTFAMPDVRAEHIRFLDDGRGIILNQPWGSHLDDAFQGHEHATMVHWAGGGGGHPTGGNREDLRQSAEIRQKPGFSPPRVADETRGRSTAFPGVIKG